MDSLDSWKYRSSLDTCRSAATFEVRFDFRDRRPANYDNRVVHQGVWFVHASGQSSFGWKMDECEKGSNSKVRVVRQRVNVAVPVCRQSSRSSDVQCSGAGQDSTALDFFGSSSYLRFQKGHEGSRARDFRVIGAKFLFHLSEQILGLGEVFAVNRPRQILEEIRHNFVA